VAWLIERYGVVSCKGRSGSVLFFHPNVVHGSGNNMSPFNRTLILVTYNSTTNVPHFPEKRRPEFLPVPIAVLWQSCLRIIPFPSLLLTPVIADRPEISKPGVPTQKANPQTFVM